MNNVNEDTLHTCRACLVLTNNVHPIFGDTPQQQLDTKITTMLNVYSIQIEETDHFPKTLCLSCVKDLQVGYNFIQTFKKSQEKLMRKSSDDFFVVKKSENEVLDDVNDNLQTNNEICSLKLNQKITRNVDDEMSSVYCVKHEENSFEADDQNFLIEQSVKLTQHYKLHKLDNCFEDDDGSSDKYEDSEFEDNSKSFFEGDKNAAGDISVHQNIKNIETVKSPTKYHLSCPFCAKIFKRLGLFSLHLSRHNNDGEIICQICLLHFTDTEIYLNHHLTKHKFQCKICQKSFSRSDTYNRHMHVHNNTLPKFVCPVENCLKSFSVKQSLRNHFMSVHSDKRNFLCNLCGASFKNYDNLRYHIKKHNGPSHLCPYCGKAFMQSVHLKYHMWRHTGIRPYKCINCEKSFFSKKLLNAHLSVHYRN